MYIKCPLIQNHAYVYRPFRAFIRDIDRPWEKRYTVAAIEPRPKIKAAT